MMEEDELFQKEIKSLEDAYSTNSMKNSLKQFDSQKEFLLKDIEKKEKQGLGTKTLRQTIGFAERKKNEILEKKKDDIKEDLEKLKQELLDEKLSVEDYKNKKIAFEDFIKFLSEYKEKNVVDTVLTLRMKIDELKELFLKGEITKKKFDETKELWEKKIEKINQQIKNQKCPRCDTEIEKNWATCKYCKIELYVICDTCKEVVRGNTSVCPNCKTRLLNLCDKCSEPLETNWSICPSCGKKIYNNGGKM